MPAKDVSVLFGDWRFDRRVIKRLAVEASKTPVILFPLPSCFSVKDSNIGIGLESFFASLTSDAVKLVPTLWSPSLQNRFSP